MLKRRSFWIIVALLAATGFAVATLKNRNPAANGLAKEASGAQANMETAALEFLESDLLQVKQGELRQILPLSGALRAVGQAAVKAKVSGEVREVLVREGEAVKAGQIVIKMDPSEYQARLAQTKGVLLAAKAQLDIATKTRDNNKALLDKNFISKNAFDNAESQYSIAVANVDSAKGSFDVAQKALADTVVHAPISGLISSRSVQPGEKVSPDNRLLDVVDLRQMELEASVPTSEIVNIALGQEVQVKVEGMPNPLIGKVSRINPSTQTGSRAILTYVQIDNPQGVLRMGMFGEAKLTLKKKTDVLTVPLSAVQLEGDAPIVYAIENGKLMRHGIRLGIKGDGSDGPAVEVVQGLSAGAQIVKANLGNFRTGTLVKIIKPTTATATK